MELSEMIEVSNEPQFTIESSGGAYGGAVRLVTG